MAYSDHVQFLMPRPSGSSAQNAGWQYRVCLAINSQLAGFSTLAAAATDGEGVAVMPRVSHREPISIPLVQKAEQEGPLRYPQTTGGNSDPGKRQYFGP